MSTVKERMTNLIQNQPEDASYEEILKELAFEQMITQGLKDSRENKTISNEDLEQKIKSWQQ